LNQQLKNSLINPLPPAVDRLTNDDCGLLISDREEAGAPSARKLLDHPHEHPELLLLFRPEREPPIHHPADAVVENRLCI
jgi:hypothetical protein